MVSIDGTSMDVQTWHELTLGWHAVKPLSTKERHTTLLQKGRAFAWFVLPVVVIPAKRRPTVITFGIASAVHVC
jgi:hypothetical protein